jgi:hypothetical protein
VTESGRRSFRRTLDLQNPVPQISSLSPSAVPVTSATFTLTINGTNCVPSSVARRNGAALATTYVSATRLEATISSTHLTNTSSLSDDEKDDVTITVQNPALAAAVPTG